MKAIVYYKYGSPDVLKLEEVQKPVPGDNQVLIKAHASSINYGDCLAVRGKLAVRMYLGLLKPKNKMLGSDIAGRVEAVGKNITQFQPGDEVFGDGGPGAFAEYTCTFEKRLAPKPANLSFEEAAAVPIAAITALQGLRNEGQIQPAQKVLINGASGGVGTFAVQLARYFGAEVTGVCSPKKMDLVHSLGVDHVIDYTREDFTKNGQRYDLILDVAGHHTLLDYRRALNPQGNYILLASYMRLVFPVMLLGKRISKAWDKNFSFMIANITTKDLAFLKELFESGKITPVIGGCYPLHETAKALRYVDEGHAEGKVAINIQG